jgi:hypothetical protein
MSKGTDKFPEQVPDTRVTLSNEQTSELVKRAYDLILGDENLDILEKQIAQKSGDDHPETIQNGIVYILSLDAVHNPELLRTLVEAQDAEALRIAVSLSVGTTKLDASKLSGPFERTDTSRTR